MNLLFALLSLIVFCTAQSYYSVETNGGWTITPGKDPNSAAWGRYDSSSQKRGWNELWISGNIGGDYSDEERAFAVGFLEGALTHTEIANYYLNIEELIENNLVYPASAQDPIKNWIMQQFSWVGTMIASNTNDPFWINVNLINMQLAGMAMGYGYWRTENEPELDIVDFLFLNSFPDSMDLANIVNTSNRVDWFGFNDMKKLSYTFASKNRCSAFIKPVGNDLFAGHTTWIFYSMLVRIFKHIAPNFQNVTNGGANLVSFSSYPTQIASADDFYVLDNELVVIETSNSIFNTKLYDYVTPQSLLSWQRTTLANRLSTDGSSWSNIFGIYNSGTYNNQWMIVDYRVWTSFTQNGTIPDSNLLWVAEQIPGKVEAADVTTIMLTQGYWASYNIPYFPYIFNVSGYTAMEKQYGSSFSWSECPRALIFKRNATEVTNLQSMKSLMRYNNYEHDPLSGGDPGNAIASRFDLSGEGLVGGIDSKVANVQYVDSTTCEAICGPTYDQVPAFSWDKWNSTNWPHYGQPTVWQFPWEILDSVN